jgi:hypothetical protein
MVKGIKERKDSEHKDSCSSKRSHHSIGKDEEEPRRKKQ